MKNIKTYNNFNINESNTNVYYLNACSQCIKIMNSDSYDSYKVSQGLVPSDEREKMNSLIRYIKNNPDKYLIMTNYKANATRFQISEELFLRLKKEFPLQIKIDLR